MMRWIELVGWILGIAGLTYLLSQPIAWSPAVILVLLFASLMVVQRVIFLVKRCTEVHWNILAMFLLTIISFAALIEIPYFFILAILGFIAYFITVFAMEDPEEKESDTIKTE